MNVLLVGWPQYLRQAYPPERRTEISSEVTLLPAEIDDTNWRKNPDALAETEVILSTWGMPVLSPEFLATAPRLRAVFYGAGSVRCFATPEAYERGIVISSAWGANAIPVAEYALAAILFGLKGFWRSLRLRDKGQFQHVNFPVAGAYRATVGLVSFGATGRRVADLLRLHEVEVIAYDPFVDPARAAEYGVSLVSLEALFERSDVVSIHAPWLPETEGMIDGSLLRRMKSGAALVNTARGAVIKEPELCEVFRERDDLTAILDVTHPEPALPGAPVLQLPNVIVTPHIAGSVGGEIARMGQWMIEEMNRYLAGEPLEHAIDEAMLACLA